MSDRRNEMFDKRDAEMDVVDKKFSEGEITFRERHELIEEIQRRFSRAMQDLETNQ